MPVQAAPKRGAFRVAATIGVVVLIVAAALIVPFLPVMSTPDTAAAFAKPKPGTRWVYDEMATEARQKVTVTAVREEGGRTYFERQWFAPGKTEPERTDRYAIYVEKGFVMQAPVEGTALGPAVPLYKLDSRKGQVSKHAGSGRETRNLGITNVRVSAGAFKDVVNVRLELEATVIDRYFAPGVGLVREEEIHRADPRKGVPASAVYRLDLAEFKPAR